MQFQNCVLVTLNISNWDANRQDKRVSEAVAESNGVTDKRLCRLRKSLLPKTAVMDRLFAVIRAARSFHYDNTHAWMHDGPRILTRANFDEYMKQMRRYQADFETAVLDFIAQYDDIKGQAAQVLGALYNASDYPDQGSLKGRYSFDLSVQPMPASASLLELGLDPMEAEAYRRKLEADLAQTYKKAHRRLYADLHERVEKLANKLSDDKAYVMPETIDAVKKLADLLPRMNLLNDRRLNALSETLQNSLVGVTADVVKTNPTVRLKAAEATANVLKVLKAFKPVEDDEHEEMSVARTLAA